MLKTLKGYLTSNHVLTTFFVGLFLFFLYEVRIIFVSFFVAYIIMAALNPFVHFLERRNIHHNVAVLIVFLTFVIGLLTLVVPLIPFFVTQIQAMVNNFPGYLNKTSHALGIRVQRDQLQTIATSEFNSIGQNAFLLTKSIFSTLFSVLSTFVIAFYLLLDHEKIKDYIVGGFSSSRQKMLYSMFHEVELKLGAWLRGQIVLSIVIGVLTWIALTLLGIRYALPLALITGILEILPTLGPILSAIPAIIVAMATSPSLVPIIILTYYGIQFTENHVLVPKIMQHAVGLNPVVIILTVAIGGSLMGIAGALLAIPFLSMVLLVIQFLKKM